LAFYKVDAFTFAIITTTVFFLRVFIQTIRNLRFLDINVVSYSFNLIKIISIIMIVFWGVSVMPISIYLSPFLSLILIVLFNSITNDCFKINETLKSIK
ncbi:TPA: hypothetical protein ACHCIQ_004457, partial [Vibrio parahaemolyticus]